MRIKASPLAYSMSIIWVIMNILFSLAFIWLIIVYPASRTTVCVALSTSLLGILLILLERKKVFSYVTINSLGIKCECIFSKDVFLSWEDCIEIGIARHNQGGWVTTTWIYWIYFSKIHLSSKQLKSPQSQMNDDYVRLQYRVEILNEVLKYQEKSFVKNMHLWSTPNYVHRRRVRISTSSRREHCLRSGRKIAKCAVWSDGVVSMYPAPRQDLGLSHCVEYFTVQKLVAHAGIEAFTITILPRASGFDVCRSNADIFQPIA